MSPTVVGIVPEKSLLDKSLQTNKILQTGPLCFQYHSKFEMRSNEIKVLANSPLILCNNHLLKGRISISHHMKDLQGDQIDQFGENLIVEPILQQIVVQLSAMKRVSTNVNKKNL